jgi:hypothetical protein
MAVEQGKDPRPEETWPTVESMEESAGEDLISPARLLRYLDEVGGEAGSDYEPDDESEDSGSMPQITRMPRGIQVEERRVGRAVAQWILHVRCDCGRRWFEVDEVDTATCPRCGTLVYVDMDARNRRR